ncbi:MAG: 2-amino-4-hydroxy-6-hydroxymethyldihydropteridine diphosphokinase [Bacteroidales bacterium]
MKKAILLLGGNKGNRERTLQLALMKIEEMAGTIIKKSSVYETAPWGFCTNEFFLNLVILIETNLSAHDLLDIILNIEQDLGRSRFGNKYQSRTIDIDILLMDDLVLNEPHLTIPHPRLHERLFTLIPLAEIAGKAIHPVFYKTINQLLDSCSDRQSVNIYSQKSGNIPVDNEI